jgi:hypothetical protein
MSATYNTLDMKKKAEQLREQLILEIADINSGMEYDYATSRCDDCPDVDHEPRSYSEMEFGVRVADSCCHENGAWEEWNKSTFDHVQNCHDLIKSIKAYLGEEKT